MFTKKNIAILVVVILLIGTMALLSNRRSSDTAEDNGATTDGVTTIRVAAFPDQDSGFEAILDDFHAEHPHIKVELDINDFDNHHQALLTQIAAGSNVPDVANIEIQFVGDFVNRGGFVNLLEEPYNAGEFEDDIIPYKWAQGTNEATGELIAMPLDVAPGTIFYRRDRFEELGVDVEDLNTLEDWIEVGLEFTEGEDDRWLFPDAAIIYEMVRRSGEEQFFDNDGNPIVTSDKFVRAFELAKQIRDLGLDGQIGEWSNEWYATFEEGTALAHASGAWLGGHIQNWMAPETAGKWGVTNLPDDMYVNWGGSFLAIPEDAQNKEAAWEFIEYVTTNVDVQINQFEAANIFPALVDAFDHEVFEESSDFYSGQNVRQFWLDSAKKVPAVNTNRYDTIAQDAVGAALTEVLEEDKDIMEALEEAETLIKRRMR
ncbi:ABC transporter substrate-binding protein [Halonatronum saccharophilum]|uniref:ABC transporter substrate-binding protein n=1 Tax=Halonatronum saccharophilum TaxID=150060 RepID=UPI000481CF3D|nr:extracellular solute-binding protein [Halonatronum saccharophilum]